MTPTSRQELQEELLEAQQTLAAVVDVLGDSTVTAAEKIRELRDVLQAEFPALDDDEEAEED